MPAPPGDCRFRPDSPVRLRPNRATCAMIAFPESDRPDRPRAGDAYATIWIVSLVLVARSPPPKSMRRARPGADERGQGKARVSSALRSESTKVRG